jgi:hypothetical protein
MNTRCSARAIWTSPAIGLLLTMLVLGTLATPYVEGQATGWSRSSLLLRPSKSVHIHSENVLSGIDIRTDTFEQIVRKLGKPTHVTISSPRTEWGRTLVTGVYEWESPASSLRLTTVNESAVEYRIERIDVWGTHPDGDVGTTGRGVKLGDPISKVRHVYGLRLYFGVTLSEKDASCAGNYHVISPLLSVDFDQDERVSHMAFVFDPCPSL